MQSFIDHVQALESALDGVVDHGTDDELFIASYLQGHVAVVAKPMETDTTSNLDKLDDALRASLDNAFENNELELEDQEKVRALWQRLIQSLHPTAS